MANSKDHAQSTEQLKDDGDQHEAEETIMTWIIIDTVECTLIVDNFFVSVLHLDILHASR